MSAGYRLGTGQDIQFEAPLSFRFNGKRYQGFAGDSLASALLASGVRTFGRSFKRHRPRGVFAAGVEETSALVQVGSGARCTPNERTSLLPLTEGLEAHTCSHWPNVEFDLLRVFDLFSALIPAGFYHKTFIWPPWRLYEYFVRQLAGFGISPTAPDPDHYAERHMSVDVLVCGGGPVGISAALAAANSGASVVIAEQDTRFGGSLLASPTKVQGTPCDQWLTDKLAAITSAENVRALTETRVSGLYDHNLALLVRCVPGGGPREEVISVRAQKIIVATGAIEQPLVFDNNDRPGIMLLGAMQAYLHRYGVVAGRELVLAGNNDLLYKAAADFNARGVAIKAIIDSRTGAGVQIDGLPVKVHQGSQVVDTIGRKDLRAIVVAKVANDGGASPRIKIPCDALGISGGLAPCVHLASHVKTPLRYEESIAAFVPEPASESLEVVGAARGSFDLEASLAAIDQGGLITPVAPYSHGLGSRFSSVGKASNQWVDLLYDVTVADLDLAIRENYTSIEHMKRYTSNGMAVDQGKTSNLNALSHLAEATRRAIAEVGTTTFRPPYMPVSLGTLVADKKGRFYAPVRELPMHQAHLALGAKMDIYGAARRPTCYPRQGEDEARAVGREALSVRSGVGICDGSALGKIEVRGPDAAKFLNFIYLNNVSTLPVGNCRYGLMLNEKGVIFDDGVFCRMGTEDYLVSTTSAHSSHVFGWMEEWLQCELTDMDVTIMNATESWANVTIAGPKARDLLARFETDIDLSRDAFPYMEVRSGHLEGVPVRIMRVSFSGEVSFEVNVPSAYGAHLWDEALRRGEDLGVIPFGLETVMVLRIEKGYMHVGTDTDGQTVPQDVGWGHAVMRKQADFIGKRSLSLPNNVREDRLQLVGLEPLEAQDHLIAGAHLTNKGESESQGYITSACFSPALNRPVGMGLLKAGQRRMGEELASYDCGIRRAVRVTSPVFVDPEGERLDA